MSDDTMTAWTAAVCDALGIEAEVDVTALLDVARDAAHAVARPAAPVTTFLMGIAVAQGAAPADVAQRVSALAAQWPAAE